MRCIAILLVFCFASRAQEVPKQVLEIGAGAAAKIAASAVFLQGRTAESVLDNEFAPEDQLGALMRPLLKIAVDRDNRSVTASLLGASRTAVYRDGLGATLVIDGVLPENDLADDAQKSRVHADAAWPTGDRDAVADSLDDLDREALARAVDEAFTGHAPPANPRTRGVVVVYDGRIVAERYADGYSAETPLHGWSMSKSVVDALIGIRVGQGRLKLGQPTNLQQWLDAGDSRSLLTLDHMLRMSAGLVWDENYSDLLADPARMLFGEADAAAFAAARKPESTPGSVWEYSSGTSNVVCRVLRESFESDSAYHAFPRKALFDRIGMRNAVFETDPSGTFIGSSMVYASARDWARFGMLYLNDGVWDGERVLPEGWVRASTTPTKGAPRGRYGRHWWLNAGDAADPSNRSYPSLPRDMFYASGYEGQMVAVIPSRRAVIVRLGCTKNWKSFRDGRFLCDVLAALPKPVSRGYSIPIVDLSEETDRQVVVDREPGQYLGHPTTVLLDDGKTVLCVYPKGHGKGGIVYKRSVDGGKTWSERLPTPTSWATSREVPTLYKVTGVHDERRLIMFSGLHPIRMARSEDDGESWTELEPIGDFGGIVAMGDVVPLNGGRLMALFHDDGRFLRKGGKRAKPPVFHVYKTESDDGGLTWGAPEVIATHPEAHLCEPGAVRSPDGTQIAVLLRENSRKLNGFVIFSNDEGATWTKPRMLPGALTGDRHTARYVPDGRLFISFRDTTLESSTKGDWVGWLGTYEDIVEGREGICRVRLMDNKHRWDCAYPGVEVLPDGTIVTTTYGHWTKGEKPYIVSVRLRADELIERAKR